MQKLLYLSIFLSLFACAQTTAIKINTDIRNTKTTRHINIPGTRLYIIPPTGFKVASAFTGLQKGDSSMFSIYDLVGGNINTNAATFNKAEFEKMGAKVFDFQEIKVNGFSAKFIHMQGDAIAKSYAIAFGDTTFTTMIMTVYPVADKKTGDDILNALNTVCYDKSKKIDPFEVALFSLDDKVSRFKFFQYNANIYIYTIDGKDNKDDSDAPIILLSQSPMDESMTPKSLADMSISKIQQYGLTNPEIKNTSTEKINGYETYQAEVYGQLNGKSTLIYYCVLAKKNKAILIQGVAKNDIENNIKDFKKITGAIKIK